MRNARPLVIALTAGAALVATSCNRTHHSHSDTVVHHHHTTVIQHSPSPSRKAPTLVRPPLRRSPSVQKPPAPKIPRPPVRK